MLDAADVHVARRLAALAGEPDEQVALAAALAVRGPRLGHVYVDLATIRETATVDAEEPVDLSALPWPAVGAWIERLRASALVAVGEEGGSNRPLRLVGTSLYLDRYWREERQVAADLAGARRRGARGRRRGRAGRRPRAALPRRRRRAPARWPSAAAVRHRFAVVAGGPGTGKTTTVARIVALLAEQAEAAGRPAAAHRARGADGKRRGAPGGGRPRRRRRGSTRATPSARSCCDASASTLHRLLGWRPDSHSRFRHDRGNRLPHDVVIVDETSMVSLSLMARLARGGAPATRGSSSSATPGS